MGSETQLLQSEETQQAKDQGLRAQPGRSFQKSALPPVLGPPRECKALVRTAEPEPEPGVDPSVLATDLPLPLPRRLCSQLAEESRLGRPGGKGFRVPASARGAHPETISRTTENTPPEAGPGGAAWSAGQEALTPACKALGDRRACLLQARSTVTSGSAACSAQRASLAPGPGPDSLQSGCR